MLRRVAADLVTNSEQPDSTPFTKEAKQFQPRNPLKYAAIFAISTAAVSTWAHDHIRAIFIALMAQSAMQLIPAIFLVLGSPMVVMFADSLGKSGNPISERNKFLAFAITSSVVLLAAFTFLLTSILGVYSGVIALRGASDAIFSLAHRLSHMAAIMAGFDVLSVAACATITAAPECTEPLGMTVAGLWFAAHFLLSLAVLFVTASHHFSLPSAPAAAVGVANAYAPGLAPRAYAAVSALFTALVFGSMLQLPAAGVVSGEFVSFQSTWNLDGSRILAVLRRLATVAAVAAAVIGLYNGGAFLLVNDFRIAEWTCQAAAALNAVALVIGGPLAALLNLKSFSKKGWSVRNDDVAWAALGQPLLAVVICGGLLATNLRLLQYAHLIV